MKIILAIFGLLFLLFAVASFIVAALLACAPLVAFVLFLIIGLALCAVAVDMDGKKKAPHPKPEKPGDN